MPDLRNGKDWDRQLEEGLPDCRLSGHRRKIIIRARMAWEEVFCANCGKTGGLVTAEWSPHVFFLCDGCVPPVPVPGAIEMPDELVRGN